ncbi:hypothetical protein OC861_001949 [Tilletia horrida]|nr:hypothetical protein OC861_001949 [Tilletia horrida]
MAFSCGRPAHRALRSISRPCLVSCSRHLSVAGPSRQASTISPPPGPPGTAPAPPQLFDRQAKSLQRSRAFADRSKSEEVDYVREMVAESVGERVKDVKRTTEVIVDWGSGPGLLRKYLDPQRMGLKKVVMCDSSVETERLLLDEENPSYGADASAHLQPGVADMVVSAGALHWTNDLLGTLIQIRRMLKPDGVFIGAMAGGDTLFELRTSLQLAEQEREGGVSPRVSPMADSRDMASLLTRAGFTLPTVDVDEMTVRYPSSFELMSDLRQMGESNAVMGRRSGLRRDTLLASAAIYEALHKEGPKRFQTPDGQIHELGADSASQQVEFVDEHGEKEEAITDGVPATFNVIYMIGWAPSDTQRKSLSRGSGKTDLKSVLGGSAVE